MAIRTCPLCLSRVGVGEVVAYSDGMECPGCKTQLEVSMGSRMLATSLGLLTGVLVWRLTGGAAGMLGWVLPMFYAFLAFSIATPLFLMGMADLRVKPSQPAAEPVATAADQSSGHH